MSLDDLQYIALIDMGSNSIRLVVYDGLHASPNVLYNESILAELGRDLQTTGKLNADGVQMAYKNLGRFLAVAKSMQANIHCIATAAIREASDGKEFVKSVKEKFNLDVNIISGEQEAILGSLGLYSGFASPCGVGGDLGGGSLELYGLDGCDATSPVSTPLGYLRLANGFKAPKEAVNFINEQLDKHSWLQEEKYKEFYAIGGSWRAIAKYIMYKRGYEIPIIHHYKVSVKKILPILDEIIACKKSDLGKKLFMLPKRRAKTLPYAAAVLKEVLQRVRAKKLIFSTFGVREGFIHEKLSAEDQCSDPLFVRAKVLEHNLSRFGGGENIFRWSEPLMFSERERYQRIHKAGCYLTDIGWIEHRDYRAAHVWNKVLTQRYGGWVDHKDRVLLASSLYIRYGGKINDNLLVPFVRKLSDEDIAFVKKLGYLLKYAAHLAGGITEPLKETHWHLNEDGSFSLIISEEAEKYIGDNMDKVLAKIT